MPLADASSWLQEANIIFGPQVNIFFTSRVILLQDRDSEDELIKTLAHEFGHTLGDMKRIYAGYPGGKGELMVSQKRFDGVRIPDDLVSVLGKQ